MSLFTRLLTYIGYALGVAICEPQLRRGRRNHDGHCDVCGREIDRYKMERLEFPDYEGGSIATIREMLNAEYGGYCLECDPEE